MSFLSFQVSSCVIQSTPDLVNFLVSSKMFTKSGLFTIFTVILLHNSNKVVSSNEFTKSGLFTIFTFTKSGVDCTKFYNLNHLNYILK